MKMPKPDPKALELFNAIIKGAPGVLVKPMFGNFGAFAGGTMFAGVFGDAVFVRLSEADRAAALRLPGAGLFEPMSGRPMKEYVVLPPAVFKDPKKAKTWVQKSMDYASTVVPKGGSKSNSKPRARAGARDR